VTVGESLYFNFNWSLNFNTRRAAQREIAPSSHAHSLTRAVAVHTSSRHGCARVHTRARTAHTPPRSALSLPQCTHTPTATPPPPQMWIAFEDFWGGLGSAPWETPFANITDGMQVG
jgi:hypothetical protein